MKFFRTTSLISQFLLLVVSSLLFLVFIAVSAYYNLRDYAFRFSNITDYSMPKIVRIANTHSNIKELAYLVEKLTDISSSISRKATYRRIEEIFRLVKGDELSVFNEQNLDLEIQVIEENFNKLHSFIKKRNHYARQVNTHISNLIKEKIKIQFDYKELDKILDSINSERMYGVHKLKDLNLLIKKIQQFFALLRKNGVSEHEEHILAKIEHMLLAPDGIIEIKKKEVNIRIRSKRLASFITSLLYNFSDEIEFLSVKYSKELIRESQESALSLKKEINTLFFLFIGYLLYLMLVIFYVKNKIINRLVALDRNIRQKIKGKNRIIEGNYKDEISYITESFNFYASKVEEKNKKLEDLSLTDSLTNLPNKRMFDIQFERELHFIQRNHHLSSILFVDVDNFKSYNDNYGHPNGDKCLKSLAEVFRKIIKRDTDTVARYGGEEFIFILSNSDIKKSKKIARDLLNAVEGLNIRHEFNGKIQHVTISIGITTINHENCKLGKIHIENADKALYTAKEKGKNTFVHYNDLCRETDGN